MARIVVTLTFTAGSLLFSQVPQSFSPTGSLNTGRNGHRAVTLNDGTVLIAGGYDVNENALASCELYNPVTGTFTATGSLNAARRNFGITLLNNGTVLVSGGYGSSTMLASAEIYDPATGLFTLVGNLNIARQDPTATLLNDGTVLVAGGFDANGVSLTSAELYIPSTETIVPTGDLKNARGFATATALTDGTVLIEGGWTSTSWVGGSALSSAEIYNPGTASFSNVGSLSVPRVRNTATLLNNGRVLIAGGEDSSGSILASAEIYDPATSTFTPTGNLNTGRGDHAATLLTNGTVLVEGGFACQPSDCAGTEVNSSPSAEIYDPVAGTFSPTGNLAAARQVHTATLLTNGSVLIAGGWSDSNVALNSAELYQPASFTPPNLISISVIPINPSVFVGASQALVAVGTFSDNSTHALASVIWSSSDNTIASVTHDSGSNSGDENDSTNSGVALGISPGTATVTACAGAICGSMPVTVLSSGPGQGFALLGSPAGRTVSDGQTATFSLVLAPKVGFSGIVTFSCDGVPQGAQCSVSPSSLRISEAMNATATVTIKTTNSSAFSARKAEPHEASGAYNPTTETTFPRTAALVLLPFSLGLCFSFPKRTGRRASIALLWILLGSQMAACGGGLNRQASGGIAPGNYVITVTGANGTMSRGAQFRLIVQ